MLKNTPPGELGLVYTNVRDYAKSKQDRIDAGLPVESDQKH
jgi:hypothetical protein